VNTDNTIGTHSTHQDSLAVFVEGAFGAGKEHKCKRRKVTGKGKGAESKEGKEGERERFHIGTFNFPFLAP